MNNSTLNANEDTETTDHSYITDGNVKWCSHSGKQFGSFPLSLSLFFFFFFFLPHLWHMEIPGLGIESEPQLQPISQLWQYQILYPTALGWGSNLCLCRDPSQCSLILNLLHHSGNSWQFLINPDMHLPYNLEFHISPKKWKLVFT